MCAPPPPLTHTRTQTDTRAHPPTRGARASHLAHGPRNLCLLGVVQRPQLRVAAPRMRSQCPRPPHLRARGGTPQRPSGAHALRGEEPDVRRPPVHPHRARYACPPGRRPAAAAWGERAGGGRGLVRTSTMHPAPARAGVPRRPRFRRRTHPSGAPPPQLRRLDARTHRMTLATAPPPRLPHTRTRAPQRGELIDHNARRNPQDGLACAPAPRVTTSPATAGVRAGRAGGRARAPSAMSAVASMPTSSAPAVSEPPPPIHARRTAPRTPPCDENHASADRSACASWAAAGAAAPAEAACVWCATQRRGAAAARSDSKRQVHGLTSDQ